MFLIKGLGIKGLGFATCSGFGVVGEPAKVEIGFVLCI